MLRTPADPSFFYKNVVWTVAMFWFLLFCSFDATYLFQYTFVLLYNLVFTSLPVAILGAFDQDTNATASMAFPQLYQRGIQGLDYTRARFWLYMLDGLYQSAIVFFIPFVVYWDGTTWSSSGRDTNDLYDLSSCMAAAAVFAANLYVGINTRYWTIIPAVVIPVSILAVFLWIAIYSSISTLDYSGVVEVIFPTFNFWATMFFTIFLAVGPHWLVKAIRQSYFYRDKDIIREAWVGGDLKDQLGIKHRKRRRNKNHIPDTEDGQYGHYLKRQDLNATPAQQVAPLLETKGYPGTSDSPAPMSPASSSNRYTGPPPPAITFEPPTQDTDAYGYGSGYGSGYDSPSRSPYSSPPPGERRGSNTSNDSSGITAPQPVRARGAPAGYPPSADDVFGSTTAPGGYASVPGVNMPQAHPYPSHSPDSTGSYTTSNNNGNNNMGPGPTTYGGYAL